jgi:hypothetical protein
MDMPLKPSPNVSNMLEILFRNSFDFGEIAKTLPKRGHQSPYHWYTGDSPKQTDEFLSKQPKKAKKKNNRHRH